MSIEKNIFLLCFIVFWGVDWESEIIEIHFLCPASLHRKSNFFRFSPDLVYKMKLGTRGGGGVGGKVEEHVHLCQPAG